MTTRIKHDKIQEALELLNEAAQEKKDELSEVIGDQYDSIKQVFSDKVDDGRDALRRARKQVLKEIEAKEEEFLTKAKGLEKKIQKNPWKYIGAVAAASWALGFLMKRK